MSLHKTVIFFSNPFGFGPTGKTVALIEELLKHWNGCIVYAASSMCLEPLSNDIKSKIIIESINERDPEQIREVLLKYNNPLVICTLNRAAIKTAKSLSLTAIFVDSLAWLWKEIPEEYLLADTYYCFDIFGVSSKLPANKNIRTIPPIFGELPEVRANKKNNVLLHIGGFKNPFQDSMSFSYLNLLTKGLNESTTNKEIIVTGGSEAIEYLAKNVHRDNILFRTLDRGSFLDELSSTNHFVTTSGLTATLESFALYTPTSFIPPTNLSQWHILKLLVKQGVINSYIEWEDLIASTTDLSLLDEKTAMPIFSQLAKSVSESEDVLKHFLSQFDSLLNNVPSIANQNTFIEKLGTNGSEIVISELLPYLQ